MLRLLRTVRLGFKSLRLHKLRSGLATLGILIGVTAVIWLVALGEGVSYQAQQQIKELGATNIIIRSVKPPMESQRALSYMVAYGLERDDFDRIISTIPTIRRAVAMREVRTEVRAGRHPAEVQLLGVTPEYFEINHLSMARGRFICDRDLNRRDNVAVIGHETAKKLFPYEDPVGKALQLTFNHAVDLYVIVGETGFRNPSAAIGGSMAGREYNLDVYIPLATFRARIGDLVVMRSAGSRDAVQVELSQITATVNTISEVEPTAEAIRILLDKFHPDSDYSITVPKELLDQARVLRRMFNVLLVLIAGISLAVGGIGIMNIMLATVTERTREIGVRRAMGAKRQDIIFQFLAETVVLSGVGGVLGVAFGFLCQPTVVVVRHSLEKFLPDVWETLPTTIQSLDARIAPWSIVAAFLISVFVGVGFGLYPARRAAMMDPIEALRHE